MFVSFERLLAVKVPLHARRYLSTGRVTVVIGSVLIATFLFTAYHHLNLIQRDRDAAANVTVAGSMGPIQMAAVDIGSKADQGRIRGIDPSNVLLHSLLYITQMVLVIVVPCVLLVVFNYFLIKYLRHHNKRIRLISDNDNASEYDQQSMVATQLDAERSSQCDKTSFVSSTLVSITTITS